MTDRASLLLAAQQCRRSAGRLAAIADARAESARSAMAGWEGPAATRFGAGSARADEALAAACGRLLRLAARCEALAATSRPPPP